MVLRDGNGRAAEGPPDHPEPSPDAYDNVASDPTCTTWRDIPDYPGYQATRDGRIRSVRRTIEDRNGMAKRLQSVELAVDARVTVSTPGRRRTVSVRALVAAAWGAE